MMSYNFKERKKIHDTIFYYKSRSSKYFIQKHHEMSIIIR